MVELQSLFPPPLWHNFIIIDHFKGQFHCQNYPIKERSQAPGDRTPDHQRPGRIHGCQRPPQFPGDDNRRFVPDEFFETTENALSAIRRLIACYQSQEDPFVYAVLLKTGRQIGHVQLVSIQEGWKIGFHTGQAYRNQDYTTEAVKALLPLIMEQVDTPVVLGVCDQENLPSRSVMEKCGFTPVYEGMGTYQGEQRPICKYLLVDPGRIEDLVGRLTSNHDQESTCELLGKDIGQPLDQTG